MRTVKNKTVRVFDKGMTRMLNNCTYERACDLVRLKQAEWVDDNDIMLFSTRQDIKEENKKIIADAKNVCYICNRKIPDDEHPTIDHVIPRSKRVSYVYDIENRKCCCVRCNKDKKNRTLTEYLYHIDKHREDYDYISKNQLKKLKAFAIKHEKKYMLDEVMKLGRIRKGKADKE